MDRHRAYVEDDVGDDVSLSFHNVSTSLAPGRIVNHVKKAQLPRLTAEFDAGLVVPNWGPPIPPSTGELYRIGMEGALESQARRSNAHRYQQPSSSVLSGSSPGVARGVAPFSSPSRNQSSKVRSSPYRRTHPLAQQHRPNRHHHHRFSDSAPSSCSSSDDEDAESPLKPMPTSRESTGNHQALAASSIAGYETSRLRSRPPLPRDALDRLDQWAAAASASASDSERSNIKHQQQHLNLNRQNTKPARADSCDPTYEYEPRMIASSPPRSPPARMRTSHHPHSHSPGSPSRAAHVRGQQGNHSSAKGWARTRKVPQSPIPSKTSPFSVMAGQIVRDFDAPAAQGKDFQKRGTSKETRDSSAETLVEEPQQQPQAPREMNAAGYAKLFNSSEGGEGQLILPSGMPLGKGAHSNIVLPDDVTGLTSALGSPVKSRLGVGHATLHPSLGKRHVADRKIRLAALKDLVLGIEEELEMTKDRLQGVEGRESELRDDVEELRREWRRGHDIGQIQDGFKRNDHDYAERITTMSQHITALSNDLRSYRAAVEDIQHGKSATPSSAYRAIPFSQAPTARTAVPHLPGQEDSDYRNLQEQVRRLEGEVAKLQFLVEGDQGHTVGDAANRPLDECHAASSRSRQASADVRPALSSFGKDASRQRRLTFLDQVSSTDDSNGNHHANPNSGNSGVRGESSATSSAPRARDKVTSDDDDEGNETPRPQSSSRSQSRSRPRSSDPIREEADDGDDVTQAQARVDQTTRSILDTGRSAVHSISSGRRGLSLDHDEKDCTVCQSRLRKETRRSGRKQRVVDSIRRQAGGGMGAGEEDLLLSLLNSRDSGHQLLSARQAELLERLIKQHIDEFIHARMLYAELADELKELHPDDARMTSEKRKILVEHVLESVEELEARCERIEGLKKLRDTFFGSSGNKGGRNSPPTTDQGVTKSAMASTNPLLGGKSRRVSRVDQSHKAGVGATLSQALANSPPLVDRGLSSR